ncbi:GDP-mannose 4,6-dehydratase [Kolteria novifilia]|uniref:GDP-mannose 4,6-dehydratase n=1 Tax=Kolteria novifilia TaxID=2527975 RepID=UPI003AF36FF6
MRTKRALITGISGQDGSYLAEVLLEKGRDVHGMVRKLGPEFPARLAHLRDRIALHQGDLANASSMEELISRVEPDEIYHLAAETSVSACMEFPEAAWQITGLGPERVFDAVRKHAPGARIFHASSSEVFGEPKETPQSETTPFHPRNDYGRAKAYAHRMAHHYRERHRLFIGVGILFNHESPRRGARFLTRKVSHSVAKIALGQDRELHLGDLHARRDWGYAGDFARAMPLILEADAPEDFVIGTGMAHSVEDFVRAAFNHVGLDWHDYVVIDRELMRPQESGIVQADPSKAKTVLDWEPSISFEELAAMMVEAEMTSLRGGRSAQSNVA